MRGWKEILIIVYLLVFVALDVILMIWTITNVQRSLNLITGVQGQGINIIKRLDDNNHDITQGSTINMKYNQAILKELSKVETELAEIKSRLPK